MNVYSNEMFKEAVCSLKETSKDNHDGQVLYMTESMLDVINFDRVKERYASGLSLSDTPKSFDALYIRDEGDVYLIEFKNGRIGRKEQGEIRLKIFDSLLILTDIIGKSISYTREHISMVLVYNKDKNQLSDNGGDEPRESQSRVNISQHFVEKRAREKFIRWSLGRFETLYVKSVVTVSKEEFDESFIRKWANK